MAKIAVIYYSSTGGTYQMAEEAAQGARDAGAEVRVLKVRELAPEEAIAANQGWARHRLETRDVPEATLDDLEWADGLVLGSPTRYGAMAAQLKQFLDSSGPLWAKGKLADKPVAAFTGAQNPHGGHESTLLTIYNVMYHWGAVIVPPGYTDPLLFEAGGNPYGASFTDPQGGRIPEPQLAAARYLGARVARYADLIASNKERIVAAPRREAEGARAD